MSEAAPGGGVDIVPALPAGVAGIGIWLMLFGTDEGRLARLQAVPGVPWLGALVVSVGVLRHVGGQPLVLVG